MIDNEETVTGAEEIGADSIGSVGNTGKSASDKKASSAGTKKTQSGEKKTPSAGEKTQSGEKKPTSAGKKSADGEKKASGETKKTSVETKKSSGKAKKTSATAKKSADGAKKSATQRSAVEADNNTEVADIPATDASDASTGSDEQNVEFLPLESLLYDSDEHIVAYETPEETAKYESFFRSYKELIGEVLADAKIKRENAEASQAVNVTDETNTETVDNGADTSVSIENDGAEAALDEATVKAETELTETVIESPAKETADETAPITEETVTEAEAVSDEAKIENEATVEEAVVSAETVKDEAGEKTEVSNETVAKAQDLDATAEEKAHITEEAQITEELEESSEEARTTEELNESEEEVQLTIAFDDEESESAKAEVSEEIEKPEKPRRDLDKYDPEHPRVVDSIFEFLELFAFTLVTVMLLTTFFFRYSRVDGGSMDKTLADGDHLLISNLMYTPERGDVIVFEDYGTELYEPLVKRIIGVAGDTVKITITGDVYVNGELLDEPYVYITPGRNPTIIHGEWYVEEGYVFVLGDHRDVSKDSREFGPVRVDSILGEAKLRFYPFDKFGGIE